MVRRNFLKYSEAFKKSSWACAHETVSDVSGIKWSIKALCVKLDMSRQNYYAVRRHRRRNQVDAMFVEELVKAERRVQPRLGARKLLVLHRESLAQAGVELGRDRFFEILREKGLLLAPLPRSPRTGRIATGRVRRGVAHARRTGTWGCR